MKPRSLTRRRSMNFRQPKIEDVDHSVDRVILAAKARAIMDHRNSFASDRERDMVASVYLERARDKLKEDLG